MTINVGVFYVEIMNNLNQIISKGIPIDLKTLIIPPSV